jgi:hypothetical protein
LPPTGYTFISQNPALHERTIKALRSVSSGHVADGRGDALDEFPIQLRMKLSEVEEGWRDVVRDMIRNYKGSNQGFVSELLGKRNGRPVIEYNELRYAS